MAAASSVFHRVRTGSKIGAQYDQDGNLIQVKSFIIFLLAPQTEVICKNRTKRRMSADRWGAN